MKVVDQIMVDKKKWFKRTFKIKSLLTSQTQQLTIGEEGNKTCGKQQKTKEKYIQVAKK